MDPLAGRLLIASAGLYDPNFRRTIVLVGHHDDEGGAVGVILNQPLEVAVAEAVPALAPLVPDGDPVFRGGPVQPSAAVVVADFAEPDRAGVIAFGSVGFLPERSDDIGEAIRRARVFAGYAGWGPGQLESELEEGSWLVLPATPGDVFHREPERLWSEVVTRLGPNGALLRTLPEDPSLN